MKPSRSLAYLALILNAAIWGAALPIVKPALEYVTPYQYLFYRYLIGTIFIFPLFIYLIKRHPLKPRQLLIIIALESLVMVIGHSLLYLGLDLTTSLEASIIGITSPVFITLGGLFFLKEKEERHEAVGLFIALAGTLIVTLEPYLSSNRLSLGGTQGNLLVLSYVLIWTFYNLVAKRIYPKINKLLITSIGLFSSTLALGFLVLLDQPLSPLAALNFHTNLLFQPSVLFASLYMGTLGTIAAVSLYIYGLSHIEASEASLFSYLQPLVAIPLAVVWLSEPFSLLSSAGLIFIAFGVIIAQIRTSTRKKSHRKY